MKKLLIIEDNEMMLMFLANYLYNDYVIELAKTPREANELIKNSDAEIDLVISDYKSKGSEDHRELTQLSSRLKWMNTPLIVLTDQDKSEERLEAFQLGAKDTLSKPFNPAELNQRMFTLLDQAQALRSLRQVA